MNRLDKCFNKLKSSDNKGLVSFVMAGDPCIQTTYEVMVGLVKGGTAVIELGVPFSDPLADGPVIQAAGLRAIKSFTTLQSILECVKKFRDNYDTPVVLLGYLNTFYNDGFEKLDERLKEYGVDGVIIPDIPLDRRDKFEKYFNEVYLIPLVAPNSDLSSKGLTDSWKGFVYCVSSYGVTGTRKEFDKEVIDTLERLRTLTELPLCVGFGLKDEKSFKFFQPYVNGFIVGSAYVSLMAECLTIESTVKEVSALSQKFKTFM